MLARLLWSWVHWIQGLVGWRHSSAGWRPICKLWNALRKDSWNNYLHSSHILLVEVAIAVAVLVLISHMYSLWTPLNLAGFREAFGSGFGVPNFALAEDSWAWEVPPGHVPAGPANGVLLGFQNWFLEHDLVSTPVREAHLALLIWVIWLTSIFVVIRKQNDPWLVVG